MKIVSAPAEGLAMVREIAGLTVADDALQVQVIGRTVEAPEQGFTPPVLTAAIEAPMSLLGPDPIPGVAAWLISSAGPFAGSVVVEDAAVEFTVRRLVMLRDVRKRRDVLQASGAQTPYGTVDTDPESIVKLVGAVTMAGLIGSAYADVWTMADGSDVQIDKEAIEQIGLLAGQHVSACQRRKKALQAQIDAAETIEDLAAMDITAGWPN